MSLQKVSARGNRQTAFALTATDRPVVTPRSQSFSHSLASDALWSLKHVAVITGELDAGANPVGVAKQMTVSVWPAAPSLPPLPQPMTFLSCFFSSFPFPFSFLCLNPNNREEKVIEMAAKNNMLVLARCISYKTQSWSTNHVHTVHLLKGCEVSLRAVTQ